MTKKKEVVRSHRERVIERTREEILLAAARLLAQNPGRPASLQEIASELGLTGPALYAYFKNKQAIFQAIVALVERETAQVFDLRSAPGTPFRDRLNAFVLRHVELTERRRDVFLALFTLKFSGEVVSAPARPPPLAHFEALQGWFRREAKATDLPGCPVGDAATIFYGLVHAFFVRSLVTPRGAPGRTPVLDTAARILELFWHGVNVPTPGPPKSPPRRAVRR